MLNKKNNFQCWPKNYPEHYNGGQLCDMLIGPCSCGASHQVDEFCYRFGILLRYNKVVATSDTRYVPMWSKEEIERRELAFRQKVDMKNVTVLKRIWESTPARYIYVPILKGESFTDLKALEKCIMDEAFINISNSHVGNLLNKPWDVFLIITPDWCKILRLVATEFRPEWSAWGNGTFEV